MVDAALDRPPAPSVPDSPHAQRVLRRLAERGAALMVAEDMDKAIVVRDGIRTATFERALVEGMALAGWIDLQDTGRLHRYVINRAGRDHLRSLLRSGRARGRVNITETPLQVLARRKDPRMPCGRFLSPEQVALAERFREDFETDPDAPATCAMLDDLGPDLREMLIRVCCDLEGVEQAERAMGLPARSGKIVLRLALIRLQRHHLKAAMATRPAP